MKFGINFFPSFRASDCTTAEYYQQCITLAERADALGFIFWRSSPRYVEPGAARAVGQALGANPFAPIVPCHRVLAAGRSPGGFSGGQGALTKLRMLEIEGGAWGGTQSLFGD